MDEGDDGDDDDGDSSRDDADDEDADEEDEEEHIAPADSVVFIPTVEPVSPPEGTEPVEVERLLAMTTPSPSPPISLSPPSTRERLARCTAPPAHPSPPPALIDAVTTALPSPPLPLLPPSLYIPPPIDHRDDVPESELPPRKRLCLSTLDSRYEIGESSTARPTRGRGVDYGFVSTVDAEARRQIMAPTTGRGQNTPTDDTNPNNMTLESVQAMIDQALQRNSTNGDASHSSHGDDQRNVQTTCPCYYADLMKC
ncbi:hypothetical protein Tco_1445516 [Tanacetum coccineum]